MFTNNENTLIKKVSIEDKYEAMIPTRFDSNHASNLCPLSNGDLLCAWFAGSMEGKPDISIVMSRLKKGEDRWSEPELMSNDAGRSEQNPVLFETDDNKLCLLYTAQVDKHQETAEVRYRISTDNGYSWSGIKTMFDKPGTFIRQTAVRLDNGDLILPIFYSRKSNNGNWGYDSSAVKISADNGATWDEYEVPQSVGSVHMNIIKLSGNNLMALFRSRKADYIYKSVSTDNGRSWSRPEPTVFPNNNSSIQCTKLRNGHLALIFNNINKDGYAYDHKNPRSIVKATDTDKAAVWGAPRVPVTIAISEDEGATWPYLRDIQTLEGIAAENPEFSYPSIKETEDGRIAVTYSYLRKAIKFASITEDWVKN